MTDDEYLSNPNAQRLVAIIGVFVSGAATDKTGFSDAAIKHTHQGNRSKEYPSLEKSSRTASLPATLLCRRTLSMPSSSARLSVVLPVRNGQHRIADRVLRVLEALVRHDSRSL